MWTSFLTIKVHHKLDTKVINKDYLMILFVSTSGNKWSKAKHKDDLKTNGQKIFEEDKMLFHTRFYNLLNPKKKKKCSFWHA